MYDQSLIRHKLQRWETFVSQYQLPQWEAIPDFGLYMDQVIVLLQQYLNFIPAAGDGRDSFVTASAINNYVRLKVMPAPVKRKYGRVHIAYIMMIVTLKLALSISDIQRLLPSQMTEEEVRSTYEAYAKNFHRITENFNRQIHAAAENFDAPETSVDTEATSLIIEYALTSGFNALLAEKLLHLGNTDTQAVLAAEQTHA